MSRFVMPLQSAFGQRVVPFDGAKLFFFDTGTSTPKDTFSDAALATPNANPVVADADGRFPDIFLGGGIYKAQLKDKNNVQKWEEDPVEASMTASNGVSQEDTVATMKAGNYSSGQLVRTSGYTSVTDGGGALYLFRTSAQFGGTPDEDGDHTADNGNIAVLKHTNGVYLAEQFGAFGDWDDGAQSGTDDSTALLALIAKAKADGIGAALSFGKFYRFTQQLSMTGSEFLYGNDSILVKDYVGKGLVLSGGSARNTLKDLKVLASTANSATAHTPANTEHGIEISSNRATLINVTSDGHKGNGIEKNTATANGNNDLWQNVRSIRNGAGGAHYSGTQDDCAVGRADITTELNFGPGVYSDANSTLRAWQMRIYSEGNWVGYVGGPTVFGVDLQFANACEMWIYSEETGANVSEILTGDATLRNKIFTVRSNLDSDTSTEGTNEWQQGIYTMGIETNEAGVPTTRRVTNGIDRANGPRKTTSGEWLQREFRGSGLTLFGFSRAEGDSNSLSTLGWVSPDGDYRAGIGDAFSFLQAGADSRNVHRDSQFPIVQFDGVGLKATHHFFRLLVTETVDESVADLTNGAAVGTLKGVAAAANTTSFSAFEIDFEYDGTTLTKATSRSVGSTAVLIFDVVMVGNVLTMRSQYTGGLGANAKFSATTEVQLIQY